MTFRITCLDAVTGKKLICGTALTYGAAVGVARAVAHDNLGQPISIFHSDDMSDPIDEIVATRGERK